MQHVHSLIKELSVYPRKPRPGGQEFAGSYSCPFLNTHDLTLSLHRRFSVNTGENNELWKVTCKTCSVYSEGRSGLSSFIQRLNKKGLIMGSIVCWKKKIELNHV